MELFSLICNTIALTIIFLLFLCILLSIISGIFAKHPPYTGHPLAKYIKNHRWVIQEIEKRLANCNTLGLIVFIHPIKSMEIFRAASEYYHPSKLPNMDWLIINYKEEDDSFDFIDLDKTNPKHLKFINDVTQKEIEDLKKKLNNDTK